MDAPDKNRKLPPEEAVEAEEAVEPEEAENEEDRANWSHDIERRDYYYDDSTGYETYDPEKEEAEEDKEDAGSDAPSQP